MATAPTAQVALAPLRDAAYGGASWSPIARAARPALARIAVEHDEAVFGQSRRRRAFVPLASHSRPSRRRPTRACAGSPRSRLDPAEGPRIADSSLR